MRFFQRFKNIFGYHILEFTVLLVVVMASIVTMGPYVLRSVNANFKGWDDSSRDSIDDPLFLAPDNTPIPDCNCSTFASVGCGLSSCPQTEQLFERTCLPLGCEDDQTGPTPIPLEKCIVDICCCTRPVSTGNCGVQDSTLVGDRPICSTPDVAGERPLNADGTCPDDYMKSSIRCGAETFDRYVCTPDTRCEFRCQPPTAATNDVHQQLCVGSNERLTVNTNYRWVSACSATGKCELECKPPFVPVGGACICPPKAATGPYGSGADCEDGRHCCGIINTTGASCIGPWSCPA